MSKRAEIIKTIEGEKITEETKKAKKTESIEKIDTTEQAKQTETTKDIECSCCSHKKKERSPEELKKLIHRLNRIEGQVRGIKGMIENDAYCTDILIQSAAVSAAMNAFNKELLANHIRSCVVENIRNGNDEVIDELVVTIQKLMK